MNHEGTIAAILWDLSAAHSHGWTAVVERDTFCRFAQIDGLDAAIVAASEAVTAEEIRRGRDERPHDPICWYVGLRPAFQHRTGTGRVQWTTADDRRSVAVVVDRPAGPAVTFTLAAGDGRALVVAWTVTGRAEARHVVEALGLIRVAAPHDVSRVASLVPDTIAQEIVAADRDGVARYGWAPSTIAAAVAATVAPRRTGPVPVLP